MIVAIDGPAGSGKSTVAHAIARRCGLTYLDTGAMYRTVTLACLRRGIEADDEEAVGRVARDISITFGATPDGGQTVQLDGEDVTQAIRTPEIDAAVSPYSAVPAARQAMVGLQRAVGEQSSVVAEGRDIGTVVYPNAEVKIYLTADASARAHRRAVQREGGDAAIDAKATADAEAEAQILADLVRRDEYDSSRKESPLKPAEDAHHIDSSTMSVDEVVDAIVILMEEAGYGNE